MRRAIRQAVADVRTGVREPYFWLIMGAVGAAMLVGALGDIPTAIVILVAAATTLQVHRSTL